MHENELHLQQYIQSSEINFFLFISQNNKNDLPVVYYGDPMVSCYI